MLQEQERTIELFRANLKCIRQEKLVIYGTGINAEAVVKHCRDYQIVGLMDAAKTDERMWGLQVLSEEEILKEKVKYVVVVARPAVHSVIYKRIREWSEKNRIFVCDIYGKNLADKIKNTKKESVYFDISYEMLIKEVEKHEVVSFDIFDTLLARDVYEPKDVLLLLDMEYAGRLSFPFFQERVKAEQELLADGEPDLYQIYERIRRQHHLTEEECHEMLEREVEKEKQLLCVRREMRDCFQYCLDSGKSVYLVSDMYFTKRILREILEGFGIHGYKEIIVSCEHGCSKRHGLFQVLKKEVGNRSWIHIGDSHEADCLAPIKNGGDAFEVMSPIRMMEISTYDTLLVHTENIETRVMLGMLAAGVFNNPFALYHSDGKPKVEELYDFGYFFIAPVLASFMLWMFSVLEGNEDTLLIFSARDGWLLQKIYHIFTEAFYRKDLPEDIYLLISREAISIVSEGGEKFREERTNYLNYLKQLNLEKYKRLYFFDFMSRGTCQSKLEEILGRKMQGVYFQRSLSGDTKKDSLDVLSFFREVNAQEKDLRIFAMCDFLECILTSPNPSLYKMDCHGNPVYEKEQRSKEQMESVAEIHRGILAYCRKFAEILGRLRDKTVSPEFCDEILSCTESTVSQIRIPQLLEFRLDDSALPGKNVGYDVFR